MHLGLTEEQRIMRENFARFFDRHKLQRQPSEASNLPFNRKYWRAMAGLGTFSLRVPAKDACEELGTFEATLLMEEVGRTLAPGPIAETIMASRLLASLDSPDNRTILNNVVTGEVIISIAYQDIAKQPVQWVNGGSIADVIIARDNDKLVLLKSSGERNCEPNLAFMPLAEIDFGCLSGDVISIGDNAVECFLAAIEEWKLLLASALASLSRQAIEMAAAYAGERKAFGQYIGTFQAISHPLATLIADTDAAKLFVWKTLRDIADAKDKAKAQVSLSLWWATDVATRAVSQSLQTFGGYGLTTDYDIHRYNLYAKAWSLVFDDPLRLLEEGARRLYDDEPATVPEVGVVTIDFDRGDEARDMARRVTDFFENNLTPELRARAHFTWEGHDPGIHKQLAEAKLLFPEWPVELGGINASPYVAASIREVYEEQGWSAVAPAVARMVGAMIHRFGSDELKSNVLSRLAAGEAVCSLGWSEPGAGSDVFAAQTRATRDGDGWRIHGQKMFTSGADIADYVYLITRTNSEVAKHKGITMFIVPLSTPGISIQAVHTFQDEPTTITFYDDVWVPDSCRLGEVDGGVAVMSATLTLEHSASYSKTLECLLAAGEQRCRELSRNNEPLINDSLVQMRLARLFTQTQLAKVLNERMLWVAAEDQSVPACGPMARLQSAEAFFQGACDLMDITAPSSLSKREGVVAYINQCYRHAHAARIYGGSQEILRSQIAESHLGMPRTRQK